VWDRHLVRQQQATRQGVFMGAAVYSSTHVKGLSHVFRIRERKGVSVIWKCP
jgi:hypothetical protein